MSNKSDDENISIHTEAYYEELACQEEIYLEETEEEVRAILMSYSPPPSQNTDCTSIAESLDEELSYAAEELVTGDADDAPLSEEVIAEMLERPKYSTLGRISVS